MNEDRRAADRLPTWMKFALPIGSVLAFFGICELLLWIVGVIPMAVARDPFVGFADYAPVFERRVDDDGHDVFETAPNKVRFFNPQRFSASKPAGARRVFCVGGSTTFGRPYDDRTSFAGWLRELLPVVDPSTRWEVVNVGGISYASYRVARVMEELADYEPDLFVVYTGHNEFLEERSYGRLRNIPRIVRSASSLVSRTRTATVLHDALDALGLVRDDARTGRNLVKSEVDPTLERFAGLDAYRRDDVLRDTIVEHFASSLGRMIRIARTAGAKIVFVTPASNLKDCSPFKSETREDLDERAIEALRTGVEAARASVRAGRGADAQPWVEAALADDPRNADLLYLRGKILCAAGRIDDASESFRAAKDEDVCPLRALTSIESAVRRVASEHGVPLVDYVKLVADESARVTGTAIPGAELFLDHVHPTIGGHRLLAFAVIDELADRGFIDRRTPWSDPAIGRVSAQVRARIDDEEQARALGNLAQVLRWAGKIEDASALAARALELGADDSNATLTASRALADAATRDGRFEDALVHIRRALDQGPANANTHFQYGLMFLNESTRDIERAAAHLFLALTHDRDRALAYQTLGLAMAERGRYGLAHRFLTTAGRLDPDDPETHAPLERLDGILGDRTAGIAPARIVVKPGRGPVPAAAGQVVLGPDGTWIRDGIWTEWHDNGEPSRFLTYDTGVPSGTEVTWTDDGEETGRTEHRP